MKIKWEGIRNDGDGVYLGRTHRAKVPGGWFVYVYCSGDSGILFYPDPKHEWDGNSLP
jgi:hypothetical protein